MRQHLQQLHQCVVVVALSATIGCMPKNARLEVEEPPAYASRDGRNNIRLSMASTLIDHGKTFEAQHVLDEAAKENASSAEIDFLRARILFIEGFRPEAEELLQTVTKRAPRDPRPFRLLGIIQADRKDVEGAISNFSRAVKIDQSHAPTYNNLGFLLYTQEDYEKAHENLVKAVTLDGSQMRYKMNLGFALAALGRDADALRTFKSFGTPSESHANFAVAMERRGDTAHAIEHHQKALQLDPNNQLSADALSRLEQPTETP